MLVNLWSEQTSLTYETFSWIIQSFEHISILATSEDKMFLFLKKTSKFLDTGIRVSSLDRVFEVNSLFIHLGTKMCNIFKVVDNQFELLYSSDFVFDSYNLFFTSYFTLEFNHDVLVRCLSFARFLEKEKKLLKRAQTSKIKGTPVGHLKEKDLIITEANSYFLISPDQPPVPCKCFQNETILGVIPPLMLELNRETDLLEYVIWDGYELESIDVPQNRFSQLLHICGSKPEADAIIPEIIVQSLNEKYWGIFLDESVNQREQFHQKSRQLFSYYFSHKYLSDYFQDLDLYYERGKIELEGKEYFFQIEDEKVTFYLNKIYDLDKIEIHFPNGKLKLVNHCRDKIIAKVRWDHKPTEYYSLELLTFRKPLTIHLSLIIQGFHFNLRTAQEALIMLVPLATQNSTLLEVESIVDLINYYMTFKFRGLDLKFLKYLQVPFARIDEIRRSDGYIELSENDQGNQIHPLSARFQQQIAQLYVRLDECSADTLLLFYFGQFGSLAEMDAVIAPGRFITAFAKKLIGFRDQFVFSIFSNSLVFLHSQAQGLGSSLKGFYDACPQYLGQYHIRAPPGQIAFENEEEDEQQFKKFLQFKSANQKHVINIYRSGLKFPPSNHKVSLGLTELLSKTDDLGVFESKLIQIYIKERWKDSIWFAQLESILLLSGILLIFIYAGFYRDPYLLTPLLVLQAVNLIFELIELNKKKAAYFRDFWNYFDILRFAFSFIYFSLAITESTSQDTRLVFLMLLSLSQTVKAFSIFSLFQSTRVLLRIVIEIVSDMAPFFIFVFATTLGFALLFTSAISEDQLQNKTYPHYMMHVFRLDFGDFQAKTYTPLEQSIFILAVIAVPLVLLNMLIAIMGDTFDRVKEEQARRDYQEMAGLVYRYEIIAEWMCSWRRRNGKVWKYIFYSEEAKQKGDEVIDPWQGRIKGIKLLIERMQKENQEWHQENSERSMKNEERQKKNEKWQSKLEEQWLKKHDQNQLELLKRTENQEKEIGAIKEMLKKIVGEEAKQ